MSIREKLGQKGIRNCIDALLIMIPSGTIVLEGLNVLPEMPKVNYALLIPASLELVDVIYRLCYKN